MSIHDIFKVPVYKTQLNLDIKKLQSFCNEYQQNNTGRIISNVGGYQSNDLPLNDASLHPLIKEINIHSSKFAKEFINNNEQALSNIWININSYKDTNKSHNHTGCDISGVYYVKTPDDCGDIVFEHPAIDVLNYYSPEPSKPSKEFNEYNSSTWWKPAVENSLYLFPGWLKHYVRLNLNETEERISISFNTTQLMDRL
jgi:uncharacterized protein (TIGR02466 family)